MMGEIPALKTLEYNIINELFQKSGCTEEREAVILLHINCINAECPLD